MALETLLYISESSIAPSNIQNEVDLILVSAHKFNPSGGITGALIFTGKHFAQVIEGDETVVGNLMASIAGDPRHDQINIVMRDRLSDRRFPDWSMAYNGPSQFVSRHVTQLLDFPSLSVQSRSADWLAALLEEFSGIKGIEA